MLRIRELDLNIHFFTFRRYRLQQAWANSRSRSAGRSPTVRQSIADTLNLKKNNQN